MFSSANKSRSGGRSASPGAGGLSFIGADVLVSGDISTTGQIHVDGRIDGNVRCATLIQGEGGTVAGHILAEEARIAGLVDGAIRARVVELEPSAKVTGDVTYETLNIAAGAVIEGRLSRREGAAAAAADAVAPLVEIADKPAKNGRSKPAQATLPALDKPAAALV
jgi:cytoskeletal protein CcmA (bactofilin family)